MHFLKRRSLENAFILLSSKGFFFYLENIIQLTEIFVLSRIFKLFLSLLQEIGKRNSDVEIHELEEITSPSNQIHRDNTVPILEGINVLLM